MSTPSGLPLVVVPTYAFEALRSSGWISIYNFDLLREGKLAAMLLNLLARPADYPLAHKVIKRLRDSPAIREKLVSFLRPHPQMSPVVTVYGTTAMQLFYYNMQNMVEPCPPFHGDFGDLVERIVQSTDGLCSSTSV